ncbi:MAG: S8 family peptidase [Bacteroidales bacterium]|nr:S8 family peptidase [Bacteroidales bacterium]
MKRLILLCVLLGSLMVNAQIAPTTCYRIYLSDKNNTPYSIDNPSAYLSARALAKRARFNIPITEQDLPVNPQYLQQIRVLDNDIRVLCVSKWMNTVSIYCPDSTKLAQISSLPFVTDILPVANYDLSIDYETPAANETIEPLVPNQSKDTVIPFDYGYGYPQIALHNGHLLHNAGFRGDSMLIVVFDAGWNSLDTNAFFQTLFDNGQVWGTRDLIPWRNNVYNGHSHGTIVTSTMAVRSEGVLVGTAPNANYFFIRSECPDSEQLIEEDFWAQAAEIADSLGADVINSSLGYTTFVDFPQGNFTYQDVDGVTSIASRAATILGQKGVVVCISAGNDGANDWHYIGHPGDAFDVLTVGAADVEGNIAPFSSRGPTYDGRVKPDITSVGVNTVCIWPDYGLGTANGTSLAGPVAAGLCACLWQALPTKSSTELMQIIRESGSCYNNPNDSLGYGIPDFFAAYQLHAHDGVAQYSIPTISVFPNPCTDLVTIPNRELNIQRVELYSIDGRLVLSQKPEQDYFITVHVNNLPAGFYTGRILATDHQTKTFKVLKQ